MLSSPEEITSEEVQQRLAPEDGSQSATASGLGQRGDVLARRWWIAGLIVYFALSLSVIIGGDFAATPARLLEFVGISKIHEVVTYNFQVMLVVGIAILLTLAAFIAATRDVAFLWREEEDVEWLVRHGNRRVLYLLLPRLSRAAALDTGVLPSPSEWHTPTLLSERVRRVHQAQLRADGSRTSPEQLRHGAESRTSRHGQLARYASGLLLLLTVLGTFSGVKTALPSLIEAVTASTTGGTGLQESLTIIAQAYGSNSLALIGAIALGIVVQGFSVGRTHFLERLESVSDDMVYSSADFGASAPLEAATQSLENAARSLLDSQMAFEDISDAIGGLERTTHDAFQGLRSSLDGLGSKTEEEFFRHSAKLFEGVDHRLGRLEEAVATSAEAYGSVIGDLNRRGAETQAAFDALRVANDHLAAGLRRSAAVSDSLDGASAIVGKAFEGMHDTVASIDAVVVRLQADIQALREHGTIASPDVQAQSEEQFARLAGMTHELVTGVREVIGVLASRTQQTQSHIRVVATEEPSLAHPQPTPPTDFGPVIAELRRLHDLRAVSDRKLRRRYTLVVLLVVAMIIAARVIP